MLVIHDAPFPIGWLAWPIAPPQWSVVFAIKATFAIPPEGGVCRWVDDPPLVTGDLYEDDDATRGLRYPTDLAIAKPRGEVTLVGTAHAPRGRAVRSMVAGFRFGAVHKEVAVVGDRMWKPGLLGGMSEPAPFTSMPLTWDRAFGGKGNPDNPIGRGIQPVMVGGEPRVVLPNLEDRAAMLKNSQARVSPTGTGPIPPTWSPRAARAGTYDAIWHATRWPWFPKDLDFRYFNAAPEDQQIVGFWKGDESFELQHLHPEHARIQARLPGVRPRCVTAVRRGQDAKIEEVALSLDTVTLDADALTVTLVWRGNRPVSDEHHPELEQVFVTEEPVDAPRSQTDVARAYHAELQRRQDEESAFQADPMPRGPRG
ncbi:MAG: DUF2169 domain-containing protein [Sandaracinaceae bacterium]